MPLLNGGAEVDLRRFANAKISILLTCGNDFDLRSDVYDKSEADERDASPRGEDDGRTE